MEWIGRRPEKREPYESEGVQISFGVRLLTLPQLPAGLQVHDKLPSLADSTAKEIGRAQLTFKYSISGWQSALVKSFGAATQK